MNKKTRATLLKWFDKHKRPLPWRKTKDPYAIWVSEIMLQQTQVVKVVDYWERFLKRFPTVKDLAQAPVADVLAMWSGLGYYSRARNLHGAALAIVKDHKGRLPNTSKSLKELPGFGPYTAGAVASIAFGEETPIVDGNVARVFSRLEAIEELPGTPKREKQLWILAEKAVKGERPGSLNEALMELGATVCLPANPLCLLCPVRADCAAHKLGRVNEIPPPKIRRARTSLRVLSVYVSKNNTVLLGRRQERGLFGGLWELPTIEFTDNAVQSATTLFKKAPQQIKNLGTVNRTLTHRDLSIEVVTCEWKGKAPAPLGYLETQWVRDSEVKELGISSSMLAVLRLARGAAHIPTT